MNQLRPWFLLLLIIWLLAPAATSSQPIPFAGSVQRGRVFNTLTTGAANTAVTATIAALAGVQAHLYGVTAYCSAGTAQLTVAVGGTNVWQSPATAIGTTMTSIAWTPVALTGTVGAALVVTLGTCGAGNTGTLAVQGDRW